MSAKTLEKLTRPVLLCTFRHLLYCLLDLINLLRCCGQAVSNSECLKTKSKLDSLISTTTSDGPMWVYLILDEKIGKSVRD
jgi:hypothetical protein